MTDTSTSFSKLDRVSADIKLWKEDIQGLDDGPLKEQFMHNVAPFFEQLIAAIDSELSEVAGEMLSQGEAIQELIDREEGFLTLEMSQNLKTTFAVGMAIVGILESEGVTLENDLKNKQLKDSIKVFKNNTTILLGQIDEITEEEGDEDDDTDDGEETDGLHGQGGGDKEPVTGGEGVDAEDGGVGGAGTGAGTGTGTGTTSEEGEH
jgi:hypothetical protein